MNGRALVLAAALLAFGCSTPPTITTPPTTSALPTPSAAAEVPLEAAMRIREEFGFRADPDWVQSVNDDPASVMSNLGIPMTADELVQLERQQSLPDDRSALVAYGIRHADEYGGLYIDAVTRAPIMLFTANGEAHQAALRELPRGATVTVLPCAYTEAELLAVMETIDRDQLLAEGIELMSVGLATERNLVALEARSNWPDAKARLEARYGGKLVATIHPVPGAWSHRTTGDGWRLVAAVARDPRWAYTVRIARTPAEWEALWTELSPGLPPPPIDLATEVALLFGDGTGGPGNCDEVRFDDLVIDIAGGTVFSRTSDPLAPRACDSMLGGSAVFIVAVARAALPAVPFTLQLHDQPVGPGTDRLTVDSL